MVTTPNHNRGIALNAYVSFLKVMWNDPFCRKRLDLEIWWENCEVWLLSTVMSSISGNMTLDLLLSHRCDVIRFITFSSFTSDIISQSSRPYPTQPTPASLLPPSSLLAQPEVPVALPLRSTVLVLLSIPLFTIRSWIHRQLPIKDKSNQSTHLHNGRYEPQPLTKIYTDTERKALGGYFLFFKGWTNNEKRVKWAHRYRANKLFLYRSYKYVIKMDGLLWIITAHTRSCSLYVRMMTCVHYNTDHTFIFWSCELSVLTDNLISGGGPMICR